MLRSNRGFTLVEMMIVILLMGMMLAFAVPALRRLGNSQGLKGTKENMIAQLQMARAKAISTGVDQPMHFNLNYGFDYHAHPESGTPKNGWKFANGVSYGVSGYSGSVTMYANGKASNSVTIPLKNLQGLRDTIVVLTSGLVLSQ